MLLLRLLAVIRWRAHKPQLNNQAVTHAALSSLPGKKKTDSLAKVVEGEVQGWLTGENWRGVIRSFSADKQTLSQPLWSRARASLYASPEWGDICAIIYSQEICWEAQGLLKEGIIWESKDQRLSSQDISMQKKTNLTTCDTCQKNVKTALKDELREAWEKNLIALKCQNMTKNPSRWSSLATSITNGIPWAIFDIACSHAPSSLNIWYEGPIFIFLFQCFNINCNMSQI